MTGSLWRGRAKRGHLAIAFVALVISGCTGTLDPIVSPTLETPVNPSLDTALEYANNLKSQYKLAVQNQARLMTWVGAGLIPLAAATGGVAVLLAHTTTTVGILGLTGASAFGTASYLRNQPAQLAYLAGHEAVNCAVRVVAPLRIVSSTAFTQALASIGGDIAEARAQLARAQLAVAGAPASTPGLAAARSQLQTTEQSIAEAEKTQVAGVKLQAAVLAMPLRLVTAVDRIQDEVDRAVVKNLPDFAALSATIGGLASVYKQLTPVVPISKGPPVPSVTPHALDLVAALDELRASMATLARNQSIIAAVVNAVDAEKPTKELEACSVNPDDVAGDLVFDPPGPYNLAAGKAQKKGFILRGGRTPFAASVDGAGNSVVIRQPVPFDREFVIETTAAARGTYVIFARDGSGRIQQTELNIGGAAAAPAPVSPGGGSSHNVAPNCSNLTASDDARHCTTPDEFAQIQKALCMPPARQIGRWSIATGIALQDFKRAVLGIAQPNEILTVEIKRDLLGRSDAEIQSRCGGKVPLGDLSDATFRLAHLPVQALGAEFTIQSALAKPRVGEIDITLCIKGPPIHAGKMSDLLQAVFDQRLVQNGRPLSPLIDPSHLKIVDASGVGVTDVGSIGSCP